MFKRLNILRGFQVLLTMLLVISVSCSGDDDVNTPTIFPEVRFTLSNQDEQPEESTRATQNNTFEVGDAIGVFAFVRTDNSQKAPLTGDYANNRKWVWNGSEFLPESDADKIFFSGSRKMDFYVYYPYSATNFSWNDIVYKVNANQSNTTGYNGSDFLTAINTTGIFNQAVTLEFRHRLSTLRLMIEDIGNITGVTLSGLHPSCQLDFQDNLILPEGSKGEIKMFNKGSQNGYFTFDACVPVQGIPIGEELFTVHRSGDSDIPIMATEGILEEGKITTLNVPIMKTVTVVQNEGGTVTGEGSYPYGYELTMTATPEPGWESAGFQVDGRPVFGDIFTYTFPVVKDVTVECIFARTIYRVNVTKNIDAAGSIVVNDASQTTGAFYYGESCTLRALTNTGYTFNGWYENGVRLSSSANYTFTVTENRNIVATYSTNKYTITVVNGSGSGTYDYGTRVEIQASTITGKTFSRWSDGNTTTRRTITVTGNATYTAEFTTNKHVVSVTSNNTNYGTVTGSGTYDYGSSVVIRATTKTGYTFNRWVENGSSLSTSANYTLSVTRDRTVQAEFAPIKYTLTVVNGTGGGTYDYGTQVTIRANTITGQTFSRWSDGNTSATRTVTVTGNATYTAQYTTNTYTISVSSNNTSYGTVTGGGTYNYGANATIRATPKASTNNITYSFLRWNDGNTSSTRSITVTANVSYTATFQKEEWIYTLSISPSSLTFTSNGGSKTFTVTSTRRKYVNGVASGSAENVSWNSSISGSGFSVSGNTVTATENNSTSDRTAYLVISQTNGESTRILLEQDGKFEIGTGID